MATKNKPEQVVRTRWGNASNAEELTAEPTGLKTFNHRAAAEEAHRAYGHNTKRFRIDVVVTEILETGVTCPYCHAPAQQASGFDIYPNRPDLRFLRFYRCEPCDAYVGCHKDGRPLGSLANAELRKARKAAHAAFDKIWQALEMSRSDAYEWLSGQLKIPRRACHIGMFDLGECNKVLIAVHGLTGKTNDHS